jgi:hypothetical protein
MMPGELSAVVSRGGRPDLALPRLHAVSCPTLLIVGGLDTQVIEMNRKALAALANGARGAAAHRSAAAPDPRLCSVNLAFF